MKQTCLLILGMHRSGTSALTGTLNILDVYVGSDLMGGDSGNRKGYFENNVLYNINEMLLSQIGSSWQDLFYSADKLEASVDKDKLKFTLEKEFRNKEIFAIKDPRIILLFPLYQKVLNELDIEIKIIIPYRNPVEVAMSLHKRNNFSFEKGFLLWCYHLLYAEKYSRNCCRVVLEYEKLLSHTEETLRYISREIGVDFITKYNERRGQVEDFLDPQLRHHDTTVTENVVSVPGVVRKIVQRLEGFNVENVQAEFDLLMSEFVEYKKLFLNKEIHNMCSAYVKIAGYDEQIGQCEKFNDEYIETAYVKKFLLEQSDIISSLEEKYQELKHRMKHKEDMLDECHRDIIKKQSNIDSLQRELSNIYCSLSWRLTRPLRKVMRKLEK
ncbi:sulfotransferase family protein [Desulfogranum japonicum]|uniref:sulfotransferase family protein n=1 Tax=Desulfogranum japonicum TaxID=231447 RepID=UPI0003FBCEA6|nr:sulfotransferase family protein [Desulfogranum japonicum]